MKRKRVTLAIRGVRCFDTSVAIITYLLAELDTLHIQVRHLPVIKWKRLITTNNLLHRQINNKGAFILFFGSPLWLTISRNRKGGRLIYRQLFSLRQMLAFLCQAVDKIHEVVEDIYLPSG